MSLNERAPVSFADGGRGTVETGTPYRVGDRSYVAVRLDDGAQLWVPAEAMQRQNDGSFRVALSLRDLATAEPPAADTMTIPVIEETLEVERQRKVTGGIRVNKQVDLHDVVVDEPGFEEEIEVERVPVNRELAEPAKIRNEGETLVVPIMEEVVVVQKRLVLKEELRITRRRREVRNRQHVELRREEATIERYDAAGSQQEHPDST